jgi:hypothetical protein
MAARTVKVNIEKIAEQLDLGEGQVYPLEKWNPPFSGDIDIVVTKEGRWIHEGGEIRRKSLVRLFASLIKQEGMDYYLVTPVEKWRIRVEDMPLHVISLFGDSDTGIRMVLSNGQSQLVDEHCGLKLSDLDGVLVPTVVAAQGLEARFLRSAYYELVDLSEMTDTQCVVRSGNAKFVLDFSL